MLDRWRPAPLPEPVPAPTTAMERLDLAQAIRTHLALIATSWPALLAAELPGSPITRGPSARTPTLPGGTARVDLIADTPRLLSMWCHDAATIARIPRPGRPTLSEVPAMCAWLRPHAITLVDATGTVSEAGRYACAELGDLAGRTSGLLDPSPVRRITIAPCPRQGCEGTVAAQLDPARPDADLPPLRCDADPEHAWSTGTYRQLAAALGINYPDHLDAGDLAAHLAKRYRTPVTRAHLHRWARDHPSVFATRSGLHDRVRVEAWFVGHRAARANA